MRELEKILEEIEEGTHTFELLGRDVDFVAIDWVRDVIRKHMNDDWISVEERLPEEPKENPEFEGKKIELYLVTMKGTKYPFRAMWNGKFFTNGWRKCNVIAWRPLPEPYRPERSEK